MHFLNVDSTFHLQSLQNRRFVILLSASQFFYNTCFFKFSFEFLQRFFNVFAFFYWYDFIKYGEEIVSLFSVNEP